MTTPITPEARAELRELLAKATAGEWKHHIQEYVKGRNDRVLSAPGQVVLRDEDIDEYHWKVGVDTDANWDFIAAAHNAMPDLLDALDAAEDQLQDAKNERDAARYFMQLHGIENDYQLAARDARLKREAAAEWIEKYAELAAHVERLKAAMKDIIAMDFKASMIAEAALAATPAHSLALVKAEVLREAANLMRQTTPSQPWEERGDWKQGRVYAIEQLDQMADRLAAGDGGEERNG